MAHGVPPAVADPAVCPPGSDHPPGQAPLPWPAAVRLIAAAGLLCWLAILAAVFVWVRVPAR